MQVRKGFTLIELLVVISIIGLLAAAGLATFSSAQKRARDAKRKSDIKAIETALQSWYTVYGSYTQPEEWWSDCSTGATSTASCDTGTDWGANSDLRDLVPDYMTELPLDPLNNTTYRYSYEPWNAGEGGYGPAGQAYDLCAPLEAGGSFCSNIRN